MNIWACTAEFSEVVSECRHWPCMVIFTRDACCGGHRAARDLMAHICRRGARGSNAGRWMPHPRGRTPAPGQVRTPCRHPPWRQRSGIDQPSPRWWPATVRTVSRDMKPIRTRWRHREVASGRPVGHLVPGRWRSRRRSSTAETSGFLNRRAAGGAPCQDPERAGAVQHLPAQRTTTCSVVESKGSGRGHNPVYDASG
jgi:hypothetical protein